MAPKRPVIVTGCGRSGTHWLGGVMKTILGEGAGAFEPLHWKEISDVVVDSRLRHEARQLSAEGYRVVHLVRDGRDVVRSLHRWYRHWGNTHRTFAACCEEWRDAVDMMADIQFVRLEDLTEPRDKADEHTLPHWTEWSREETQEFWMMCGDQMRRMGYP